MRFLLGSDDSDELAGRVAALLRDRGHAVEELPVGRWPHVARQVAEGVAGGKAEQGVLFCWTGTGTAMAANKVAGVRAALVWDPWLAEGARRWNDANVLVMSLKRTDPERVEEIVDAWLAVAEPDPDERQNIAALKGMDAESRRDEGSQ